MSDTFHAGGTPFEEMRCPVKLTQGQITVLVRLINDWELSDEEEDALEDIKAKILSDSHKWRAKLRKKGHVIDEFPSVREPVPSDWL